MKTSHKLAALALLTSACEPNLDVQASRVTQTRVVAVRAVPAEARPGQTVSWQAIVVSPLSATAAPQIDWSMCMAPRNPSDSITVAGACFAVVDSAPDAGVAPIVTSIPGSAGANAQGAIPTDACRKIGPEVPGMNEDGSRQRPPDADITGGYQLPIRLVLSDATGVDIAFDRQRVRCNLASAPAAAAREYDTRYKANENPTIEALEVGGNQAPADGSARFSVPRGSRVPLRMQWAVSARESYVLFDPIDRAIAERTEQLDVSWYTNGGELKRDRTTADSAELPVSSNELLLDSEVTQPVTVWIVLRDDRGGVGVSTLVIQPS